MFILGCHSRKNPADIPVSNRRINSTISEFIGKYCEGKNFKKNFGYPGQGPAFKTRLLNDHFHYNRYRRALLPSFIPRDVLPGPFITGRCRNDPGIAERVARESETFSFVVCFSPDSIHIPLRFNGITGDTFVLFIIARLNARIPIYI